MRQIFIIFLSLLFFQSLHSKEKTTENLLKDIIKIQEKISKLKKPKNEEALKIDLTLKEINKLVDHSIKNVKNNNLELAISALNLSEKLLKDTSSFIPDKYTNIKISTGQSLPKDKMDQITKLTKKINSGKQKKIKLIAEDMNNLNLSGINTYKLTAEINILGIKTINNSKIIETIYPKAKKLTAIEDYNKRLAWMGKNPVKENDVGFKDWAQVWYKGDVTPYTPLEAYKKTQRFVGKLNNEEISSISEDDVGFKDWAQTFYKEEVGAYSALDDYKKTQRFIGKLNNEEIASISEDDVGFKDWAQTFYKEDVTPYTPLEAYKKTQRFVGKLSTDEINSINKNDVGFKSWARVYHKEEWKQNLIDAKKLSLAEINSTSTDSIKSSTSEISSDISESIGSTVSEVSQDVRGEISSSVSEVAESVRTSDDIYGELAEINNSFFDEARAAGQTLSEYHQSDAGKANAAAAAAKRKELADALAKGE